jgi:hypothetical protein
MKTQHKEMKIRLKEMKIRLKEMKISNPYFSIGYDIIWRAALD